MNVNLGEHYETLIKEQIASGRFLSASEVVRAALRQFENDAKIERVRAAIALGDADIAAGDVYKWTESSMEELTSEAREASRLGLPIEPDVLP
jgi:antitoxin ParD1/3/4